MHHVAIPTPSLHDHWTWRPEWAPERPRLLWYFTFDSHPQLARTARLAQDRLRGVATVDTVPVPWLHMTLADVGFVDEVPPDDVDRVVETTRRAVDGWASPPITLGHPVPMVDAVVLPADPAPDLEDLCGRLRAATTAALGGAATSLLDEHPPHVTLGYLNSACAADEVMAPLERLTEEVVVPSPRLTLASVTRRDRHYQWTARAELAVTGTLSAAGPGTGPGPRPRG